MGQEVEGQPIESLRLIRTIEESLADLSGDEFFVELVTILARELEVHCAFVTEFMDDNTSVSPLAMWCKDAVRPAMKYPIAGTPCESVLNGDTVSFDEGVVHLFPEDQIGLTAIGAESFLAIPLKNRLGCVIGHVALMDNRPRRWDDADISVLRLFAARATTEVERRQFESELKEANRELEARVRERTRELAMVNERLLREIERERRLSSELADSEAGFRALFEHSPVSVWELDLSAARPLFQSLLERDGSEVASDLQARPEVFHEILDQVGVRRFNRASIAMFGVDDPRAMVGSYLRNQPPATLRVVTEEVATLLAGASTGDREIEQRSASGELRAWHVFWSVPPGCEASWSRILLSFVDLTEQKRVSEALARTQAELEQRVAERTAALSSANTRLRHEVANRLRAEKSLREREADYRDLYENAPNVYWSTGANGRILRVNAQASKLLGYPPEEIVGRPLLDMLADGPHGKEVGRRVFQRFLEGKPTLGQEVEFRASDGRSVWVDVNVVPIFGDDGKPVATRSMVTDITARKEAQVALARRLELDHVVLEISTVLAGAGALTIEEELHRVLAIIGERTGWDHVAVRMRQGTELPGASWRRPRAVTTGIEDPAVIDELAELGRTLWWPSADAGESQTAERLRAAALAESTGTYVAAPLIRGERRLGLLELAAATTRQPTITSRDRSTVTLIAELLGSTLSRCETELELVAAKRLAESASKAKSDFLASMSHELRTPLNVILGYTQLLRRKPSLDQSVQSSLATLQRSGEHLLHLIDDVLQLARVEAGKLAVEPRTIRLRDAVSEVSEMFRDRVRERAMQFRLDLIGELPESVHIDDRRLRQVLINLLGNAAKFSPAGSEVALEVTATNHSAGIWTLSFTVSDQGMGIDPADQERIFEPFLQLCPQSGEGVGLGLAITRTLVTALGGRISVHSEPGAGSAFVVEVPAQEVAVAADVRLCAAPISGYAGRRRTVMLVDDRDENRTLLREYLDTLGFEVVEAADGLSAIEAMQSTRPDAALIDLVMPVMDGFETIRRLRALPAGEALKIVAVSASAFDTDRTASLECGGDDFLPKPLVLEQVAATIGELLELDWLGPHDQTPAPAANQEHALSREELDELRRATVLGDVSAIEAWIEARAASRTGDPLLARLGEHLKRFDVRAIERELAETRVQS